MIPPNEIPSVAWQRRLSDIPAEPGHPTRFSLGVLLDNLQMILRLRRHHIRLQRAGRVPVIDFFNQLDPGPWMGVPLGGLGGGTITRGWQGDFNRWQMQPGMYQYGTVPADQFSVYVRRPGKQARMQVLYPGKPESGVLAGWAWDLPGEQSTYHALYPRAWTVYEGIDPHLKLTCRQVSPVIPHNYTETSTPAGAFVWTVENSGDTPATVGLMLTFQNGIGADNDRAGGYVNRPFTLEAEGGPVTGVTLSHTHRQDQNPPEGERRDDPESGWAQFEDPLTFAIAAHGSGGVEVSYRARFVTTSSGMDVWGDFRDDGRLENVADDRPSMESAAIGAALCATVEVPPGESREVAFSLAWDMPVARFGEGRAYWRRYTRFYGHGGDAAPRIARDALLSYPNWEAQIAAWQDPILEDERLPDWYKSALFNESYFLTDGGTIWTDGIAEKVSVPASVDADPVLATATDDYGHFAYLEGHEYRMYNSYDVHFYASFALLALWPELELSLQRDVAHALAVGHPERRLAILANRWSVRKMQGAIPHDLGSPTEDPWVKVNAYDLQDVARWKDLNSKFVLQVYRDFVATQDIDFLAEMWEPCVVALDYLRQFDDDDDGMIENEGFPDQTYDTWMATGPSAYSGGLWLAALSAAAAMGDLLGYRDEAATYRDLLAKGQAVYEDLLWTGEYYAYDASASYHSSSIMADQLAGQWYALACGLPPIVPQEHAVSAWKKVYELNVMRFEDGEMGAVNGMRPDGRVDASSMQSQEVWTGTTYAVAAAMLHAGLDEQAWATARGIYRQAYGDLGYWFMTPEAWNVKGNCRSLAYMRPLAVWAIQWAWARREA